MTERNPSIDDVTNRIQAIRSEIRRRIVGQERVVDHVLACLLCDGNALLESTPGLGKTLLVRTLAEVTDLSFSRIQNTPDLMPSDVIGTEMVRETDAGRTFTFEKGPVFANLVLSDEINRATPKTQSALLEAMEEGQVTAGNETYDLPEPFFVLATQNPIDQEGTYPLPEAQSDRFLLKVVVDYPPEAAEREIVDRYTRDVDASVPVEKRVSTGELRQMQRLTHQVPIADDLRDLAVGVVRDTRTADDLEYGASPRASMSLVRAAKARALIEGRTHVSAADVTAMAPPVLRHRVVVDFRAEREGLTPDDVIQTLVEDR
ncbi:AAA family ATPase [Halorussus amylolyticus]|uniref:AAA family ATPase n=1 Tax=Halorussus amylolyticus TaxID=1126242 RepID=UPI001047D363|nr:MoxR family ATPase [Halorussus amylolyticus]